ncbi:MAG: hypothetical protein JO119_20100 [Acidobacteria bacterium]|nr:hypothetical protein [Acidobacteriota bacterium]
MFETTEFLSRLASQLKLNKQPAERRAIEKLLKDIAEKYEDGRYANRCDAERDFRDLVDKACAA